MSGARVSGDPPSVLSDMQHSRRVGHALHKTSLPRCSIQFEHAFDQVEAGRDVGRVALADVHRLGRNRSLLRLGLVRREHPPLTMTSLSHSTEATQGMGASPAHRQPYGE